MAKFPDAHTILSVEFWYETQMEHGIGTHKLYQKHMLLKEIIETADNYHVITNNTNKLMGLHHIQIIKTMNGKLLINQLAGYNDQDGLFGYLVNPDNTLERFC